MEYIRGMGPVYCSEIFPLRLRVQHRGSSGVVSMTFISLYKGITIRGAFFMYAGIASVAWVFFYVMLPKKQGKTLEEMEWYFGRYHEWRSNGNDGKAGKKEQNPQLQMRPF